MSPEAQARANAYQRGYNAGRRSVTAKAEPTELQERYRKLLKVTRLLWMRLSIMNGWAYLLRDLLPREDTIPANIAALEAGRALGLGEE